MGRKRGFDLGDVLEVVRDQFWDHGYEGTSTYDLMDATGLGKGSIYKAFGNKHDLYLRALTEYSEGLVTQARAALSPEAGGSPRARVENYLTAIARSFSAQSPRRGCFLTKGTVDLADNDEPVAEVARNAFARIATSFAEAVEAGQSAGEIAPDVDAAAVGYLFVSVIRGIDTLSRSGIAEPVLLGVVRTAMAAIPGPGIAA
ncbi:MAG TPA: TetR/AcrR family transcriptional regulator [Pseudonocardia sp.]|jgi:AcrR family transcriptional regulator|nr:TetR/AcrR family transcriptional regulator [Pseudonocardia sp.]